MEILHEFYLTSGSLHEIFFSSTSGPHGRLVLVPNECPSYNNI